MAAITAEILRKHFGFTDQAVIDRILKDPAQRERYQREYDGMSTPYDRFIERWNGRYVDYDGWYGYQCVDLMRQYCQDTLGVNGYVAIPPTGSAKNIFKNFRNNKYFTKVLNGPNNIPTKGDIIFWDWYPTVTGWDGHVAMFHSGDLYTVVAFGQNYPTSSPCKFTRYGTNKWFHGYRGVLGWLTPKV